MCPVCVKATHTYNHRLCRYLQARRHSPSILKNLILQLTKHFGCLVCGNERCFPLDEGGKVIVDVVRVFYKDICIKAL